MKKGRKIVIPWDTAASIIVTVLSYKIEYRLGYLFGLEKVGFPVQWLLYLAGIEPAAGGAETVLLWKSPSLYAP